MADLNIEGMALADGVVETIIAVAIQDVEGVASVGGSAAGGLRSLFGGRTAPHGIEILANDDDTLSVAVRIEVTGGCVLPDVADNVREAVSDALSAQVGINVASVDVFIDAIRFAS